MSKFIVSGMAGKFDFFILRDNLFVICQLHTLESFLLTVTFIERRI